MIDIRIYDCPIRLWDLQIQAMITRTELTQQAIEAVEASIPTDARCSSLSLEKWAQHNLKAINDTISQSTGYAVPSHTWDDAGEFLYQDRGVCEVHVALREGEGIRVPLCVDGLDVHRILEEHGARRVDSVNVQVVPKFLRLRGRSSVVA